MPYALLEKEIEKLDETQQNTVVLFVRFLLSQKSAAAATANPETRHAKVKRGKSKRKSFVEFLKSCPVSLDELDFSRSKDMGANREPIFAEDVFA